ESYNILKSLGGENLFLLRKLKELSFQSITNYVEFLRHISNEGVGEAWQKYIRHQFVTPYIDGYTDKDFGIIKNDYTVNAGGNLRTTPNDSVKRMGSLDQYFESSRSTRYDMF